jgi:hypothetical protein
MSQRPDDPEPACRSSADEKLAGHPRNYRLRAPSMPTCASKMDTVGPVAFNLPSPQDVCNTQMRSVREEIALFRSWILDRKILDSKTICFRLMYPTFPLNRKTLTVVRHRGTASTSEMTFLTWRGRQAAGAPEPGEVAARNSTSVRLSAHDAVNTMKPAGRPGAGSTRCILSPPRRWKIHSCLQQCFRFV